MKKKINKIKINNATFETTDAQTKNDRKRGTVLERSVEILQNTFMRYIKKKCLICNFDM